MSLSVYLIGPSGAGKDAAADALESYYGLTIVRCARIVYRIAREVYGMTHRDRRLLQAIGDTLRSIDDAALVRYMVTQQDDDGSYVCPDVRTVHEAQWLHERGWIGIRIERDIGERMRVLRDERCEHPDAGTMSHATETEYRVARADVRVFNDGASLRDFQREVVRVLDAHLQMRDALQRAYAWDGS